LLAAFACVNAQHVEVKLANNAAGADCFSTCLQAHGNVETDYGDPAVACVAACPGAVRDDGDCGDRQVCVESKHIAGGKTTLVVLGAIVLSIIVLGSAGSAGGGG